MRTMIVLLAVLGPFVSSGATNEVDALTGKLEVLERRVAELEANRCRCPACMMDARKEYAAAESARDAERQRQKKASEVNAQKAMATEREMYGPGITAFVKEYFDVRFGEPIGRFTNLVGRADGGARSCFRLPGVGDDRVIPLARRFWYFKGAGSFFWDRLYRVYFTVKLDDRYSEESCDAQFEKVKARFFETVLPEVSIRNDVWKGGGYSVEGRKVGARFYRLSISNEKLRGELDAEARKKREAEKAKKEAERKSEEAKREAERKSEEAMRRARGETLPEPE